MTILESLGGLLGVLEGKLGPTWPILGPSWAILVPTWTILGPTWTILEPLGGLLGPSWGHHGPSWGQLDPRCTRNRRVRLGDGNRQGFGVHGHTRTVGLVLLHYCTNVLMHSYPGPERVPTTRSPRLRGGNRHAFGRIVH